MAKQSQAIGGLHEVCYGVPDLESAISYWQAFGYQAVAHGRLDADRASVLYGVRSAVESVRLRHLDADHGHVRLMRWESPSGTGVGLVPLRGHGNRWVAQFARSCLDISNHVAAAKRKGAPMVDLAPSFIDLSAYNPQLYGDHAPQPFHDRLVAVREYTLLQPLWRQAFLERFHYDSPLMGRIDDGALLRTSQIVNASFIVSSDDATVFDFYEDVLGLKSVAVQEVPWDQAMASRGVFDLREGEMHWCHTLEEPRSGQAADTRRSGRLYLFRFPKSAALPDRLPMSQPGHLGCTLYTWRVRDLAELRKDCARHGNTVVGSQPVSDEFGVEALPCITPDGMTWTFQQATSDEVQELSA